DKQVTMSIFHEQGPAVWRREWNRGFAAAQGDGPAAQQLAELFAETDVAYDPTLVVLDCMGHLSDPRVTEDPAVPLAPEEIREGWHARAQGRRDTWAEEDLDIAHRAFQTMLTFTSVAYQKGARMLVGSDAPNPFVVPGASL